MPEIQIPETPPGLTVTVTQAKLRWLQLPETQEAINQLRQQLNTGRRVTQNLAATGSVELLRASATESGVLEKVLNLIRADKFIGTDELVQLMNNNKETIEEPSKDKNEPIQ